jgi:dihydroflavonol-4-reductase
VRILVTGASGFIGSHICAELVREGASVRGFCRSEPPAEAWVSEWMAGDVTDPRAVERAMAGCDAVVHAAALYSYSRADSPQIAAVNVQGTRNVLEAAARGAGARVVMTSSSATCGPVPGRTATESDRPPAWETRVPYKRTKIAAEGLALAAAKHDVDVVCVNPTTVLGPGDRKPTPSGKMIRDLVTGRIPGYIVGAGINVVAVEDVARGHRLALAHGRSGERYILGGDDLSLREAFAYALAAVGRKPARIALPWSAVYGAAILVDTAERALGREPQLLVRDEVMLARTPLFFSSAKAASELGYRPRPSHEALAAAAHWFADAQHAPPAPVGHRHRRAARHVSDT